MASHEHELNDEGLLIATPDSIMTFSGKWFRPLHPEIDDIDIRDIAHALSMEVRWTGHVDRFYSVAEHSVLASRIDPTLETLLHDGSEAYLSDLARPVKHAPGLGEVYLEAEARLERAIALRFGLSWPMSPETKFADDSMLKAEAQHLLPGLRGYLPAPPDGTPTPECWSPELAEAQFLARFKTLGGQL